jgi:hypothetical protein
VKLPRLSRRRFLTAALLAASALGVDAKWVEPTWLKTRFLRLGSGQRACRFIHLTDIHHKGDRKYLETVVRRINSLAPDFVCFTGDLIEESKYLDEVLAILSDIRTPIYGVPGNHDYWSRVSFAPIHKCFQATGGAWLLDEQRIVSAGKINLIGITCKRTPQPALTLDPARKNILLMHYPAWVKRLGRQKFDLMLAGHSHGGQVRIPFYGPVVVPFGVDEYDLGWFSTPNGPLYVNPGIGYIYVYNFRFNCRPEITVIEV